MRDFRSAVLACILFALVGCSKGIDTVIPSDMSTWEKELAPVTAKLTEEQRGLFASYVVRVKMSSALTGGVVDVPFGTTVAQAIESERRRMADEAAQREDEKKKEAAEKALKDQWAQQRDEMKKAIRDAVTVVLVGKDGVEANAAAGRFRSIQRFLVGVTNNSNHAISGVSGELQFVDLFGQQVGTVAFRITESIAPHGGVQWVGERDYNEFIAEHRAVWRLEEGEFTTRFEPEALVFSNGIKLLVPDK